MFLYTITNFYVKLKKEKKAKAGSKQSRLLVSEREGWCHKMNAHLLCSLKLN